MADRGHVSGEGSGVKGAALGKVFKVVMDLFALFGFARHFSVSGLNSFFLHSQGSVNIVQLVVEPTGVTDGIAVGISPPQGGGGGLAVRAGRARPPGCRQSSLGFDQGPVLSVHFVIESTGVTQVVPGAVSSPQGG